MIVKAGILALAALLACASMPGAQAPQSVDQDALLQQARESLTGEHKDTERAKKLLLDIVQLPENQASPSSVSYACVYLGYIEDRAGNRQAAIAWYEKALDVEGAPSGILTVAKRGLAQPVTWIRHLDAAEPAAAGRGDVAGRPTEAARPEKAYVTSQPPAGLAAARNLSAKERLDNFEALWSAIDTTYACFKLKSIDWQEVGERYRKRLETVAGDDDFYLLMFQLINELKDTHSWLQNYRVRRLDYETALPIDLFEGRPYVVAGEKAGWEVLSVDGLTVAEKMEALRPYLHAFSSDRAFEREAGRRLLAGERGSEATVQLRSPDGGTETLKLRRETSAGNRRPVRTLSFPLTRQRFVHFGRHPSGLGYIWIEALNGHEEVADEFDRALEHLRDTPGLILDIRDNQGGFGQPRMVGRFLRERTLVSIAHVRNGPGHGDLARHKGYLEPSGKWQYAGPVALLVNDLTGSAADLLACDLRSAGRVVTVGTTTHGNLSGVSAYAVLPCGLVVRISNGYLCDAKGRPIEGNGNIPDVTVEPTIQDFLNARDPVLDRAIGLILKPARDPRGRTF
ncbi:MAG: S41 family peptidase [Bryobacteraceae bacterium]